MKKNLKKENATKQKKSGYKLFNKIEILKKYLNDNIKPNNKEPK
jgi:hypothetical protein